MRIRSNLQPAPHPGGEEAAHGGEELGLLQQEGVVAVVGIDLDERNVVPFVTQGWTLTDAATICAARDDGAIAQLRASSVTSRRV